MRRGLILAVLLAVVAASPFLLFSQELFLVKSGSRWCAFTSEAAWKSGIQQSAADQVAEVKFSNGKAVTIQVTQQSESGDWIIYDEYTAGRGGLLLHLTRRINLTGPQISVLTEYDLTHDAIKTTKTETKGLATGRPTLPPGSVYVPKARIYRTVREFPFAQILSRRTKSSQGCQPGSAQAIDWRGSPFRVSGPSRADFARSASSATPRDVPG